MNVNSVLNKRAYAGLFLVTLATLMYEILLTRIFSVTMWYHFAFVAVSVAMFGMTVGAILVYLFPKYFQSDKAQYHLALSALWFSITIVFSFLTHLSIPFAIHKSLAGIYTIGLTYFVISIPFVFSGVCVCIALTKFPDQISKLYAADLAGAAVGCVLLVVTLSMTDGPTAVLVVAAFAAMGAVLFSYGGEQTALRRRCLGCAAALVFLSLGHAVLVKRGVPLLRMMWVKGQLEEEIPRFERWNSFSRITIFGNPGDRREPFGWGLSPEFKAKRQIDQLKLTIDSSAVTVLTKFDGDISKVDYLKQDVTNVAHYLRPASKVLVVGTGGGRDILSALAFDQKAVVGVEVNHDIIRSVTEEYGEFTGHLAENPKVSFVNDEARSYVLCYTLSVAALLHAARRARAPGSPSAIDERSKASV
jgi:hypothetical protein